jgi:hypothetical protein
MIYGILVCVVFFAGCTGGEDDIWYMIESAEDLNGDETGRLYINQDGTRLREFLTGGVPGGLLKPFGVSGNIEFVLERL